MSKKDDFDEISKPIEATAETAEPLTSRLASKYLGIAIDTLYKHISAGRVPAFKRGNRWLFEIPLLDKWLDQQRTLLIPDEPFRPLQPEKPPPPKP